MREKVTNLVEQQVREEVGVGEVVAAARAIALVAEVRDDAHVAEAVAARGEERVLDDLHANRAEEVLVRLRRGGRERAAGGRGGGVGGDGGAFGRFRFDDGGDERPRGELFHERGTEGGYLFFFYCGGVVVNVNSVLGFWSERERRGRACGYGGSSSLRFEVGRTRVGPTTEVM